MAAIAKIQRNTLTGMIAVPPQGNSVLPTRYEKVIDSGMLTVNGDIVITHDLNKTPAAVRILNGDRVEIRADQVSDVQALDVKALVVNLLSYVPFANYLIIIEI